jgi:hypothetical protein
MHGGNGGDGQTGRRYRALSLPTRQAAKRPGLAERSYGEFTRSGCQPTGNESPVSRPCLMGQRVGLSWVMSDSILRCSLQTSGCKRSTWINLIYPTSTREPREAGRGCSITTTYTTSFESIDGNMGELIRDVKESGSNGVETHLKASEAPISSQRGHSSRRTGKPRTGRRATACEVPQSTTLANGKAVNAADVGRRTRG